MLGSAEGYPAIPPGEVFVQDQECLHFLRYCSKLNVFVLVVNWRTGSDDPIHVSRWDVSHDSTMSSAFPTLQWVRSLDYMGVFQLLMWDHVVP